MIDFARNKPLEDEFSDILKKARTGQGLSVGEISRVTGLPGGDILALERGEPARDRTEVHALAKALGLRPEPLTEIALDQWKPVAREAPTWIRTVKGAINGYAVQGYVVHDKGEALIIDTAYNAAAMIELLGKHGLRLVGICLTHGHADHAEGIAELLKYREVPVYLGPEDIDLLNWRPRADLLTVPTDGLRIQIGHRVLHCLRTPGHTAGGICYRLDDPREPACFVGDTLFAGSIGRSNPSRLYQTQLDSVHTRLLALSSDHRLFPGHGPATTVAEELDHNPFVNA